MSGTTTTRVFNYAGTNNRLSNVQIGGTNNRVFTYNAAGGTTGDNRGAAGNFTWTIDRGGRPATSLKGGVNQGTYTYDAFERLRVRVVANQTPTTNNGTVHYVWDIFGNIIAEANGSTGATLREMVYLEGMPLSAIDAAASPKKIYAVHVDHLNRPVMLTDAAKVNVLHGRQRSTRPL